MLSVDIEERGFRQALEQKYHESINLLINLNQHLLVTDKIINQIVYRLYRLTKEEIRIMEGSR